MNFERRCLFSHRMRLRTEEIGSMLCKHLEDRASLMLSSLNDVDVFLSLDDGFVDLYFFHGCSDTCWEAFLLLTELSVT